jgi:hypothetical protein
MQDDRSTTTVAAIGRGHFMDFEPNSEVALTLGLKPRQPQASSDHRRFNYNYLWQFTVEEGTNSQNFTESRRKDGLHVDSFALQRVGSGSFKASTCTNEMGGLSARPIVKLFNSERVEPETFMPVSLKVWNEKKSGHLFRSSTMTVEWLSENQIIYGHRNGSCSLIDTRGGGLLNVFAGARKHKDKNRGALTSFCLGENGGGTGHNFVGAFGLGGGALFDIRTGGSGGIVTEYVLPEDSTSLLSDNERFRLMKDIHGIVAEDSLQKVLIPYVERCRADKGMFQVRLGCWTREGKLLNERQKDHTLFAGNGEGFRVSLSKRLISGSKALLLSGGELRVLDVGS